MSDWGSSPNGSPLYGTGKFIGTGITPHIPVWDMSKREEGNSERRPRADRRWNVDVA
jgi:hypothetical protein